MEPLQESSEIVARHLVHIEMMLIAILVILTLGALALVYLFARMVKETRKAIGPTGVSHQFRDLMEKGEFDRIIELASQRISSHPNDAQTHWYLA